MKIRSMLLVAGLAGIWPAAAATVAGMPEEKATALGEQMFRKGVLPSGAPMLAHTKGGTPAPGMTYACASCHLRSGIGATDEGLSTPAINGFWLSQPLYQKLSKVPGSQRASLGLKVPPTRPAYDDASLARAIRQGADPSGRGFNPRMPLYDLGGQDMEILVHYLKNLSSRPSPGVSEERLRFATVLTEEVSPEDREAMLLPLDNYILMHNRMSGGFGSKMYVFGDGQEMRLSFRELQLDRWELKGPPATWRRQLEAYNEANPVFALLGGISYGAWQPIHDFCESQRIPCLFPVTDYPVVSDSAWYTQYLSRGFQQEGITAAHHLHGALAASRGAKVLQVVQDDPRGRALAAGFLGAWRELGGRPVKTVTLTGRDLGDPGFLAGLVRKEKAAAVLLWTGPEAYPALAALAAAGNPPSVYLPSGALKPDLAALPAPARSFTYITYPYRHPQDEPAYSNRVNPLLAGYTSYHPETRISTRMYSLTQVLTAALVDMEQNFFRDAFLDVIGMQRNQKLADYEWLGFGPGQRYASRGCYIMQLSADPAPVLVKKSGWLVY